MSSTKPTIQLATPADLPAVEAIVSLAYTPYLSRLAGKLPAPMTADYPSLISSSSLYTLIADGDVVGCISLAPTTAYSSPSSTQQPEALEINNLAIHPSSQGKGYGKLLLAFAEDKAKEMGLSSCCLYTNVRMVENVTLYKKIGYQELARYSQDGFERVFFVKVLLD
jgi:ribosomal protein S18 acetylase RimI-like enzyme